MDKEKSMYIVLYVLGDDVSGLSYPQYTILSMLQNKTKKLTLMTHAFYNITLQHNL